VPKPTGSSDDLTLLEVPFFSGFFYFFHYCSFADLFSAILNFVDPRARAALASRGRS
jgi:hypothetical protein